MSDYKICTTCNTEKPKVNLCKSEGYKDGFQNECKECRRRKSQAYKKTKTGVIHSIYDGQKSSSKRRKIASPSYSKKWLIKWLLSNPEFHRVYDMWVISGYETDLKPSVDRIDDYIGYAEYNIQLLTWKQNRDKSFEYRKNGKNNKTNKAVLQYSLDGDFVAEYFSMAEVQRKLGIDHRLVSDCCRGRIANTNGYIFKYKKMEK